MPTTPRACAGGNYTCGGLAYGDARYCHEHDHPTPKARKRINVLRELHDELHPADA